MKDKHLSRLFRFLLLCCVALSACDENKDEPPTTPPYIEGQPFPVTDVRYAIAADNPAEIEADLQQHLPYPAGSQYILDMDEKISFEGDKGTFSWMKEDGTLLKSGELTYVDGNSLTKIPEDALSFMKLQMPPTQISAYLLWKVCFDKETTYYHALLVHHAHTRRDFTPAYDIWLYEDLTARYRAQYPHSNVKAVARVFISEYKKQK